MKINASRDRENFSKLCKKGRHYSRYMTLLWHCYGIAIDSYSSLPPFPLPGQDPIRRKLLELEGKLAYLGEKVSKTLC